MDLRFSTEIYEMCVDNSLFPIAAKFDECTSILGPWNYRSVENGEILREKVSDVRMRSQRRTINKGDARGSKYIMDCYAPRCRISRICPKRHGKELPR